MSALPRIAMAMVFTVAALGSAACGGDDAATPDLSVESAGPHGVATTRWTELDTARDRSLVVQAWYPSRAAAVDVGVETFEDEPNRSAYAAILAAAPASCPSRTAHAAPDAAADEGTFPVVLFSHCHECTRWSTFTIAERLASHGFVVIAVEHTDNTLWDKQAGTGVALSPEFLQIRAGDVRFVLDQVTATPPPVLAGHLDLAHVGVYGHSFGAITAGLVAQDDPRILAAAALAAPMENPLVPGVTMAALHVPVLFWLAQEDNSITELGNQLIRTNFAHAPAAAWKLEVADAGHWSVADVVGAVPDFAPGCGAATRQTDDMPFSYLDPATGRDIAAGYVTAFFRATLQGDAGAEAYLGSARPSPTITVEQR